MKSIHKKAFTLVELLVVISIIGVLSSTVFATLSGSRVKAKEAKISQIMMSVNSAAYNCVSSGNSLTVPASDGVGGTAVCAGDSAILPNITDTDFAYCGLGGCGGWASDPSVPLYSISVQSGGGRYIVCGWNRDSSGWFTGNAGWNFIGKSGCVKKGF